MINIMNKTDADKYKDVLLKRKAELEEWSSKSLQSRDAVELDQTRQGRLSRQDALMQQEMAKASERARRLELQKIKAALKRIESDDFGFCVKCDERIAQKRLDLDPAISLCINCAQ